tara:strand:- start:126 stop:2465 length:2340 start_codon:yes stop_codon:yes gene_type:complete
MASLADSGAYLDQLYKEKFGREPDAAGKAYWKAEIESGKTSPARVAELFDSSAEGKKIKAEKEKKRGEEQAAKDKKRREQEAAANAQKEKEAKAAAREKERKRAAKAKERKAREKAAREQKAREEQDIRQFIEDTYQVELNRDSDKAGADYWAEQISSGKQTKQEVLDNIRRSEEYKNKEALKEKDQNKETSQKTAIRGEDGEVKKFTELIDPQRNQQASTPALADKQDTQKFIEDTYQVELNRDPDKAGAEYWAEQINSGKQTKQEVVDNIRRSEEYQNINDSSGEGLNNEEFLQETYQEVLGRDLGDEGKEYWMDDLAQGATREEVKANIQKSDEYQKKEEAKTNEQEQETQQFIEDTYQVELNRDPDQAGAEYWAEQINSGNQTKQEVIDNIKRSEEYQNINNPSGEGLNNEEWLQQTYQDVLGRDLGDEGKEYWMGDLGKGATREEVQANIERSDEYQNINNPSDEGLADEEWLQQTYQDVLGRDLGDEGRNYWLNDLAEGATREEVLANIERSNEKWLGDTYQDVLNRDLGDEGREYWMNDLDQGATREEVLANIERSDEYQNINNPSDDGLSDTEDTKDYEGAIEEPDTTDIEEFVTDTTDTTDTTDYTNYTDTTEKINIADTTDTEDTPGTTDTTGVRDTTDDTDDADDGGMQAEYDRALNEGREKYSNLEEKYARLESDYDDARREADSYFNAQRADETSQLTRGFNVGGFPGRTRGNLASGATATSDRSRQRSRITAGPRATENRRYASAGLRSGAGRDSSYYDSGRSFR